MSKKRKMSFRNKIAADTQKQKAEASSFGYLKLPKSVSIFKEQPGTRIYLDILPYEVTDDRHPDKNETTMTAIVGEFWYKRPFKIHRNIGVDNDVILCPTSIGRPCPVCEYRVKRMSEGADKEETDTIKASKRTLYCVIPKNNKEYDEVPHIWDISHYLFQNLLNDEMEEDERYMDFPLLEDGYTLKVRFDSKTIGSSKPFADASRIDFVDRDKDYDEDILEDVPNLDECLSFLSYSALKAKFFELEEPEEEEKPKEEPEEEKPRRSRKRKTPEPEEPPETEPEEAPEPEPEEEPKKDRRKERRERRQRKEPENRCTFGHKFGIDCDEKDDCAECPIWDDCVDEQERLNPSDD